LCLRDEFLLDLFLLNFLNEEVEGTLLFDEVPLLLVDRDDEENDQKEEYEFDAAMLFQVLLDGVEEV
jgi:hypothetical protein